MLFRSDRPLKLSFVVNNEKIENVKNTTQFINLAVSKKKDEQVKAEEERLGRETLEFDANERVASIHIELGKGPLDVLPFE